MRILNKYDFPSVFYKGVNYFPQGGTSFQKRNGVWKSTIQGVAYMGGKLRQDTFYIPPTLFIKMNDRLTKYLKDKEVA
jgi:hypothetical protein